MARFLLGGAPAMSVRWEFWDALFPLRSGEGVCDIPVHFGDDVPAAVEAARREPGSRGLDGKEVAEVAKHQETAEAQEARLGDGLEILILSVGAGLLGAVSALYYHWNGYHRKAKECWLIVSLSVLFHCLLAAVLFG